MRSAKETLQQFYAAVQRRDLVEARQYLDDNQVFVGLFETYPNADAYIHALTGLLSVTTAIAVNVIVADGNETAIFFMLETKPPVEAKTLVAEWHTVRNGKIVRSQSAFDGRVFAPMFAGAPADQASDEEAIRALKEVFAAALLAKDAKRRASIWAGDGTVSPPQGGLYRGRADIERHFATEAASITPQSTAKFSNFVFRFINRDTAFVDADLTLGNVLGPDGQMHDVVSLSVAFMAVRKDGTWFVQDERAHFNS
jgi:uncharacterized protein (TIGR02246 family)